jgi:type VI secretion system protein ImpL
MDFISSYYIVRGWINNYAYTVKARWLFTLVWALALAAVVWFYGNGLVFGDWRPLESVERRLMLIGVILLVWIGYVLWRVMAQRRANAAIIADLGEAADEADQVPDERPTGEDEVAQLRLRLREALTAMRRVVGGGRGYVYRLPWYLVIGAPGSGKTTALGNSGLKFPLGDQFGPDPIAGVAGTRNCDWWFAEDAILIDTAGRYTTPDGKSDADKIGWREFLALLKRHRRLQPINGVLIMIGVDELANATPADRLNLGRTLRRRLRELEEAFGLRVPIYLVVTKVDRLAGFVPFFDSFSRSDREQPWGVTFALNQSEVANSNPMQDFPGEFDLLVRRLNDLLLERLQQELDVARRSLVFGFPSQVSLLKEPVQDVLTELVAASKFDKPPLLRGVYLASSTQAGAPIDRLMQSMAASFGLPAPRQPMFAGVTKSYFLTGLFKSLVFNEAGLVSTDLGARRRLRRFAQVAAAASMLGVVGLGTVWGMTYIRTVRQVAAVTDRLAEYRKLAATIPAQEVADSDFPHVAEALDALRNAPDGLRTAGFADIDLGLGQADKVLSGHHLAYRRALNALLLPRILVRLQNRMREPNIDPDLLFESLKLYLMLGNQGTLDREFAETYLHVDLETLFPGESRANLRHSLEQHFAALVADPIEPIALDENLIGTARKNISGLTPAARAFAFIRRRARSQNIPDWRPIDKIGAGGGQFFVRPSGKTLADGIPGLFTRAGYIAVVLPSLGDVDRRIDEDGFVQGVAPGQGAAAHDMAGEVLRLYRSEFEKNWRDLLGDIRVTPLTSLPQAADVLAGLASSDSPLKRLLAAVAVDSNLQAPADKQDGEDATRIRTLIAAAGQPADAAAAPDPFKPLRDYLTGSQGAPAHIDDLMRTLDTLYRQVNRAANGTSDTNALLRVDGGMNEANQALLAEARRLPAPVDSWMAALATDVSTIAIGKSRNQAAQAWSAGGQHLCELAVNDHYPFYRAAPSDISIEDFTRLFGPNGQFDKFFHENLEPLVDTSSRPWHWRAGLGKVGESSGSLDAFERAATIRDAFFAAGGAAPLLNFDVTPVALDAVSTTVLLANGEQEVTYNHGPVRPYTISWPNGAGPRQARLSFQPSDAGSTLTRTGPWALFRLIDAGKEQVTQDRIHVTFTLHSHSATFDLSTGSALNPLTLPALREFRCPEGL